MFFLKKSDHFSEEWMEKVGQVKAAPKVESEEVQVEAPKRKRSSRKKTSADQEVI